MSNSWIRASLLAAVGVASLAVAGGAFAADLPYRSPEPYGNAGRVSQAWQGFYVGAHAGYTMGGYTGTLTNGATTNVDIGGNSLSAGLFGGYNHQLNPNWVVGGEADITWMNTKGGKVYSSNVYNGGSTWGGSLRGRVGYVWDQFMFYGTGGLALGNVEFAGPLGSNSATKFGYVLGLGVEGKVTENLFARAEYLYTSLASGDYAVGTGNNIRGSGDYHTVRLGVGYRF
jgi:outer membrane immunogenic protein